MPGSRRDAGEHRFREEVLNVRLADLLHQRGLLAVPETIRRGAKDTTRLPDVVVGYLQGLRVFIEGKVADSPEAQRRVEDDARKRVEEGLTPICLAVLYPPVLRHADPDGLPAALSAVRLRIRVFSEEGNGEWVEGDVDTLSAVLRRAYDGLIREDLVNSAVREIDRALGESTSLLLSAKTSPSRLREVLGIQETPDEEPPEGGEGDE